MLALEGGEGEEAFDSAATAAMAGEVGERLGRV